MAWYLNPFLTSWEKFVDSLYPNRPKTSDGKIGDILHQGTNSDHNQDADGSVDAWDMTTMGQAVFFFLLNIFKTQRGARYVIFNRKQYRKANGWKEEPYTGANPHDKHTHWNSDQAYENDTPNWFAIAGGTVTNPVEQATHDVLVYNTNPWVREALEKIRAMQVQQANDTAKLAELDAQDANADVVRSKIIADLAEQETLLLHLVQTLDVLAARPTAEFTEEQVTQLANRITSNMGHATLVWSPPTA